MRQQLCSPVFRAAFSLVELSIVLVIVGLLTGGILMGQSLIRNSQIQKVIGDYQAYRDAAVAFRDQYDALPGDMSDAVSYWGAADGGTGQTNACTTTSTGTAATCNGNGDGRLAGEGIWGGNTTRFEIYRAWQQLANAKLVNGNFSGIPVGTIGSNPGVNVPRGAIDNSGFSFWYIGTTSGHPNIFDGAHNNVIIFGNSAGGADITIYPILKPEEAWNIDTKIDDGRPGTGLVHTIKSGTYSSVCPTTNVATTAEYNLSNSTTGCALMFNTGF
jgi:prepilin-type N-terminal cleavage/methylation domain-containing protein